MLNRRLHRLVRVYTCQNALIVGNHMPWLGFSGKNHNIYALYHIITWFLINMQVQGLGILHISAQSRLHTHTAYQSLHIYKIWSPGVQWLSGRVLDSKPRGRWFEPHLPHWVVSLSKNINPSLVLVQPRKTCPFITGRLLMGRKESNQTKQNMEVHESSDLIVQASR